MQIRAIDGGSETFTAYRAKILSPEGLALGKVTGSWSPSTDDFIVHGLKIIRDGRAIDVLKNAKFQVIQRENNLEQSVLDGVLTATLEVPGLQIGDELEFAGSVRSQNRVMAGKTNVAAQLQLGGGPGAYRVRMIWPAAKKLRWQATADLPKVAPTPLADERQELTYELRDPSSALATDGAPIRYNYRRFIEFSDFVDWAEVSHTLHPLFEEASRLDVGSAVREEAAKIAASTADPVQRTEAALRLVEEQVRYVYVGLGDGAYKPANAEETWLRRFGDCKAKTVLLIALLRELGIASEPALVASSGGDGMNERLPSPALFDHVLVRTSINGRTYWLDGTRRGDRRLSTLPNPEFRWALPLRAGAVDLEAVPLLPPEQPQLVVVKLLDASAGFDTPAKVEIQNHYRGDEARIIRMQLAALTPEDADRTVKAYWRQTESWADPSEADWRYDEERNLLTLSMSGTGKLDWEGNSVDGRYIAIHGAGQSPPAEPKRPLDQDQAAPWATQFPFYKCQVTTIKLPVAPKGWGWDFISEPMNVQFAGMAYWRVAGLQDGLMRTVQSRRTLTPEITAAEAKIVVERLPTFNNRVSHVVQVAEPTRARPLSDPRITQKVDWSADSAPCAAPS